MTDIPAIAPVEKLPPFTAEISESSAGATKTGTFGVAEGAPRVVPLFIPTLGVGDEVSDATEVKFEAGIAAEDATRGVDDADAEGVNWVALLGDTHFEMLADCIALGVSRTSTADTEAVALALPLAAAL
jgi:hypothetical protein